MPGEEGHGGLCRDILKLEEEIDKLFGEYETSNLSEDELRKKFEEPLNRYRDAVINLLKSLGADSKYIDAVNDALNALVEDSGRITDPDPHDYWWSGWRYLASVVSMLCGEAPRFGSWYPDEEFGLELVKTLWELPCRVGARS